MRIAQPQLLAGGRIEAREHALRAECEHAAALDHRHAQRPIATADLGSKRRWVLVRPDRFAGGGVERLRDLLAIHTVKKHRAFIGHCYASVAAADFALPECVGALRRPFCRKGFVRRGNAVAFGSQNLRPVAGSHRIHGTRSEHADEGKQAANTGPCGHAANPSTDGCS